MESERMFTAHVPTDLLLFQLGLKKLYIHKITIQHKVFNTAQDVLAICY